MNDWIDIRCPFGVVNKKSQRKFQCNRLCVKVSAGATGEGFCNACKKRFQFSVEESRQAPSINHA